MLVSQEIEAWIKATLEALPELGETSLAGGTHRRPVAPDVPYPFVSFRNMTPQLTATSDLEGRTATIEAFYAVAANGRGGCHDDLSPFAQAVNAALVGEHQLATGPRFSVSLASELVDDWPKDDSHYYIFGGIYRFLACPDITP